MDKTLLLRYLIPSLLYCAAASAADAPLTFEGRFEFRTDQESLEIIGKQVCFFPAPPISKSIPRPAGDHRLPWFCFSNSAVAASRLGISMSAHPKSCGIRGTATVVVMGYNHYSGEGDGNDVAELETVLNKSQPEPVQCSN